METGGHNRLGILGGTFNPVHMGHLILAQDAVELFSLSGLVFVPASQPPHKKSRRLAPAEHRLAMLQAAIEGDLRFSVSDIEIRRGGLSYTVDTVRELHEIYRDTELHFIIGSDSLRELHMWKDIYKLLDMCSFDILERPGCPVKDLSPESLNLKDPWPTKLLANAARGHLCEISSSDIRYRIAEGMSIRYLVHPAVEMYITEHSLYSGD